MTVYETEDTLGRVHYPFPLKDGTLAHIALPPVITVEDAERLVAFVLSLVVEDA